MNLAWDPNPDPDTGGYVVRYGSSSGDYTAAINVGNATSFTIADLNNGQYYYFTIAAYTKAGIEGELSNEVSAAPWDPPPDNPPPDNPPPDNPPPDNPPPDTPPPPPGMDSPTTTMTNAPIYTLQVAVAGGVNPIVRISPPDSAGGISSGRAPFSTLYSSGTVVTVSAPLSYLGLPFLGWTLEGADSADSPVVSLVLTTNEVLTARYGQENLAARWAMDEGTGKNANSTPNQLKAVLDKGTTWIAGLNGPGALHFDGKDDQVKVTDNDLIEVAGEPYTLALWVRTTRVASQALLEKEDTTTNGLFLLALSRNPGLQGGFSISTGAGFVDSIGRNVTDGAWHHLAVVYTGNQFKLYLDGRLDTSANTASAYKETNHDLKFGRTRAFPGAWPYEGDMDDVYLYGRALSAYEVVALMRPLSSLQFKMVTLSEGAVRLIIYSSDGQPVNQGQLDQIFILTSDNLNLPLADWVPSTSRPLVNGTVGEWAEPGPSSRAKRFYRLSR